MPKTNFTKVESSLEKGMEKMLISEVVNKTKKSAVDETNPKLYLVKSILWDIDELPPFDPEFFKKLGVSKREIKKLLKNPETLKKADWDALKVLRAEIDKIKKELQKEHPGPSDEDVVESERKKHLTKRFNVNDRWLPLD